MTLGKGGNNEELAKLKAENDRLMKQIPNGAPSEDKLKELNEFKQKNDLL